MPRSRSASNGMNKRFFMAVMILAGTIIGAGVFSLPYVFREVGFFWGIFYLVFFTGIYFAVHVMYASTIETKDGNHQFFYYAREYLRRPFGDIAAWIILFELLLVLAVYLILVPAFAPLVFGEDGVLPLIVFWFLGSLFMFARLELVGWAEFLGALGIILIVATILVVGFINGRELSVAPKAELGLFRFLLPFGPLLFSIAGRPAIGKVVEEHRKSRAEGKPFPLKKSIFWGTAIPSAIYLVFVFGVLRLNSAITPETLNGLSFLPAPLLLILGLMGLITLWTSYFMVAINVKDILVIDLGFKKIIAGVLVAAVPLGLYFAGFQNFLSAVSFTGSIFLALEGIFVTAMWRSAFPAHRFRRLALVFYLVFLVAIAHEVAKLFI